MKKHLAIFLSLALSFSTTISVFGNTINSNLPNQNINIDKTKSFSQNGITYTITQQHTETLKGYVSISSGKDFRGKNLNIPQTINYQGKTYTVESIGQSAFRQNNNIETVTIPNTVTAIGSHTFTDCQNLKSINVIAGANKYKSFNGVLFNVSMDTLITYPAGKPDKQYTLPVGVKKIEQGAFYNNKLLENLVANSDLEEISDYAFSYTQSLKEVSGILKLKSLGNYAFANSSIENIYLSTYLEKMGTATFYNSNIKSIEIPYRISTLPDYTFYNCKNLKNVTLRDGLYTIGDFSFAYSGLEKFNPPKTLNSIGFQSFANCSSLKTLNLNDNLKTIKDEAFLNCSSLTTLEPNRDLKDIGNNAFLGCNNIEKVDATKSIYFEEIDNILFTKDKLQLAFVPPKRPSSTINIPRETESIREDALSGANSIDTFVVDANNQKLSTDEGILYDKDKKALIKFPPQKSIVNFTVPDTVENIYPYAFKDATNLSGFIHIPASTSTIGTGAFDNTPNIDGFNVSDDNSNFSSNNDILYNNDLSILLKYPARKTSDTFTMLENTNIIDKKAFENANISSLNVGVNVHTIEQSAFLNSNIKNINIPSGVTTIKENAFTGSKIENVVLPPTLQTLENNAFSYCPNLKSVQFNALQINYFGYNMFMGSNKLQKVIVPVNSYYNYKNYLIDSGVTNWQNILQEYKPPAQQNINN